MGLKLLKAFSSLIFLLIWTFIFCKSTFAQSDTLVVGYTSAPPYIIDEGDELAGINLWLWGHISEDLNLIFELKALPFDQLISGLKTGAVDICINPLTMTANRSKTMLFTSPFYVANGTAVVKKKGNFNAVHQVVRSLFSAEFLSALLFLLLIITFFGWLTWLAERKQNSTEFRPGLKGIWDGFWWSCVTMTTVGYGRKTPSSFKGKIVALVWMFTALIFISGLTAGIASSLFEARSMHTRLTLNDLRDLEVGTMANTSMEEFLRKRFFSQINVFSSIKDGFDAIQEDQIDAFIYDEPILKYRLLEQPKTTLTVTDAKFNLQLYAFGLSKDYQHLVPLISERILYYTNTLEWNVLLSNYELEVL